LQQALVFPGFALYVINLVLVLYIGVKTKNHSNLLLRTREDTAPRRCQASLP
jgi:hypothetical protein